MTIFYLRIDIPGVTENWERSTNDFLATEIDFILKTTRPSVSWKMYNNNRESYVIRFDYELTVIVYKFSITTNFSKRHVYLISEMT